MEPKTSIYHWPDGANFTCFVWAVPSEAHCYKISLTEVKEKYPILNPYEAVRRIAIDRFSKGES